MEQVFQLTIQTPTKVITMQTTDPEDVLKIMQLSGQQVVSHEVVAIDEPHQVEAEGDCEMEVEEEFENTPANTKERSPRVHGDITDFGAPGQGKSKHGYRGTAASGDKPLTYQSISESYAKCKAAE